MTRTWMSSLVLFSVCTSALGQRSGQVLRRQTGSLAVVTAEEAITSVQRFGTVAGRSFLVKGIADDGPVSRLGKHYVVVEQDGSQDVATYFVRASDGTVLLMANDLAYPTYRANQNTTPKLSLQQAKAIAVEFLRAHYPPFATGRWWLAPEGMIRNLAEYHFTWCPRVGPAGALGPWDLSVNVNGRTGEVYSYWIPPNRPILAPTVPRISLAEAIRRATPYAFFDTRRVPFNDVVLHIVE